ncbi:hypothetical protein GUJ93_ZPchr0011g27519 [Zizania palustris]|uniref:Uncharacterized protein n=1 Tax=Zizania palustris TaxID=103762 RepID=A0A8J5WHT9_ZIZPA|nr:hypothetical protein GUJ93_ZPchr0011g27519 [Zizania palustris]
MASRTPPETAASETMRVKQHTHADGHAAVLAIGTANPEKFLKQDEFVDWYFRVTKSDHLGNLKSKMKRICDRSGIRKRHFFHSEEMIAEHPEFLDAAVPSLDERLGIAVDAMSELAVAAAASAIAEWGRAAADITHLVVGTNSGAHAPGVDLRMATELGLRPTVQRTLFYLHGCSAGCSALRVAKDIAENNSGARVLVASADVTLLEFRSPDESRIDSVVAMTLFGDGAGAVVVGADPINSVEHPIFHMVHDSQTTIPATEHSVTMQFHEYGIDYRISGEVPAVVREGIEQCLADAMAAPLGLTGGGDWNWNNLFWAMHPGGRAILDSYEAALKLDPGKLAASRRVLSEYGNMLGATIIFVLDELRRRRRDGEEGEPGRSCEWPEWGAIVGLGPGLTVETMVLRAAGGHHEG